MKKLKSIFSIICILLIVSCDDYLDETNPNSPQFPDAIKTLEDTNRIVNGVYNTLFHHYALMIEEDALRSDEGSVGNRSNGGNNPIDRLVWYKNEYNSSTREVSRKWAALYRGVFFANQALFALDVIEPSLVSDSDLAEWNKQRAEALFFRGLYHFYLHSTFNDGNVIIREQYEADIANANQSISPSEDVIAFFRNDLEQAIEYLPLPSEITENGRITKGAAKMILANSYLYEGTTQAINTAELMYEEIINDYGYQLETDMTFCFMMI